MNELRQRSHTSCELPLQHHQTMPSSTRSTVLTLWPLGRKWWTVHRRAGHGGVIIAVVAVMGTEQWIEWSGRERERWEGGERWGGGEVERSPIPPPLYPFPPFLLSPRPVPVVSRWATRRRRCWVVEEGRAWGRSTATHRLSSQPHPLSLRRSTHTASTANTKAHPPPYRFSSIALSSCSSLGLHPLVCHYRLRHSSALDLPPLSFQLPISRLPLWSARLLHTGNDGRNAQ